MELIFENKKNSVLRRQEEMMNPYCLLMMTLIRTRTYTVIE